MKTYHEINKKLSKLTENDQQKVREITKELQNFSKKGDLSPEGLKTLQNIQTSLNTFVEQYSDRVIRLLKQHHMMD
jgi:DNA repair ATPase RecN|tara:strand:- start:213 stop:440 length:228 start_codon:yes stop_codon:yes gene_type:complete